MMLDKFFESVGGKLGENWTAFLFKPAALFWVGGLAAWSWGGHWWQLKKWALQSMQLSLPEKIGFALLAYLLILASDFIMTKTDVPVARILEGYWPAWLDWLRSPLVSYRNKAYDQEEQRFQELQQKLADGTLTSPEKAQLAQVEKALRRYPSSKSEQMPTRLGSLLRAGERRPADKYGLDAVICWPRLWLLLPDGVKSDLREARGTLNGAIRSWFCSLLFLIWVVWTPWALLVTISGMLITYSSALDAAEIYSELIESAFDVHRIDLFTGVGWTLPTTAEEQRQLGRELTEYFWRGTV